MHSQKRSRAKFESDNPPSHAPYAVYGTPLPAFDPDVRDDGSYVPVWKQEVTDEHGRKRLHGAFTGGWSAGYYNTVGSKEGWAPSTFVSSRSNRASAQQRAEDFMDDEDKADRAEAQILQTKGDFAGLGTVSAGSSTGMFSDLFKTTGDTMGTKLLQRMGWRPGQGIGPRVKRLAHGDKTGEEHEFPPDNAPMITFTRKTDRKGLGLVAQGGLSTPTTELDDEHDADARILSSARSRLIKKPKPRKSTIGVAVLNDTGSDDEDSYAMGPQIKYSRTVGGDTSSKITTIKAKKSLAGSVTNKLAQQSVNITGGLRKGHDGRMSLDGFVLSSKPSYASQVTSHAPPDVPSGWMPSLSQVNNTAGRLYQSTADAARASNMDHKSRAATLGEQALPGKSIFDYLTPDARNRLADASGRTNLPQARSEAQTAEFGAKSRTNALLDRIPALSKDTAIAALKRGANGWMPYAEDENKRARYRAYLNLQAGLVNALPERPSGFSTSEWVKEMQEFSQAAEVFRPISGLMATRFTSSSSSPKIASDQPDIVKEPAKPPDPAEEAARAGIYGPLTRSRNTFRPTRLLCKRFGIRAPSDVGGEPDGSESTSDGMLVNQASINRMMQHAQHRLPTFASGGTEGGMEEHRETVPAVVHAEVNEAIEGSRPDASLLKAIFEDT